MSPVSFRRFLVLRSRNTSARVSMFLLFALLVCLGASRGVLAQENVGFILGTVTDQSGAAVTGAKVTITWQSTGFAQSTVTNKSGYYTSAPLQVGQYTVSVAMAGFAPAVVRNVTVDAGVNVQTDLTLHVGSASTDVTVEATRPVMDTTDGVISNTIDAGEIQQLPTQSRDVQYLAMLTPGVESAEGGAYEGFLDRGGGVQDIRIAGGVPSMFANLLDGVTNIDSYIGETAIVLKSDAVQEFNIMSGVLPAQFGYTTGGVVNTVTRAGSNEVHGAVYEYFQNDYLNAETSFPRPSFGKPEERYNDWGIALGGPILKNKLFLFGNYEGYPYRSTSYSYYTVPTAQERTGNFSDLGQVVSGVCKPINIYDDGAGTPTGFRPQFDYNGIPNNIDPARLDPVALAYQALYYPLPNNAAGSYNSCTHANNFLNEAQSVQGQRQGVSRADYRYSDKDSIMARYGYFQNTAGNNHVGLWNPDYLNRHDTFDTFDGVVADTHTFSPTLLDFVRLGVMRQQFPFVAALYGANIAQKIGLPNDTGTVPPVMNNGVTQPNTTVGYRATTMLEVVNDFTWIVNKHTLHLGGSARWVENYNLQASGQSGTYGFSSGTTAEGNDTLVTTGTGSQYASYLLGQVNGASQSVYNGFAYRQLQFAGYVQDDWRITPLLTLNAGLRWDFQKQPDEKNNALDNFDITKTNPVNGFLGAIEYAGVNGVGRNFVQENYGDWGPRLGFAWAVNNDHKTIIRGGAALYYTETDTGGYNLDVGSTIGFASQTTSYGTSLPNAIDFQLSTGLPSAWLPILGAAGGQDAFLGESAIWASPSSKDPSSTVYTLTASRELPGHLVADVTYMGNEGRHFIFPQFTINALNPQYFSLGTVALSAQVPNPYAGQIPQNSALNGPTITKAQSLVPFPYMSGVNQANPRVESYNSQLGEVSVQRRIDHGFEVMGAYTRGKIMDDGAYVDDGSVATQTGATPQNPRDVQGEWSVDAVDVKNRLVVSAMYQLPFGKGQRFLSTSNQVGDRLLSGWNYNIIMTLESGRPIGVTGATNQGIAKRPNWNPGVNPVLPHPSKSALFTAGKLEWFNPLAFTDPPDYSFGNIPRYLDQVRGPGLENFDMNLRKATKLNERFTVDLELDAINALNHDNLSAPNSSFTAGSPANPSNPYAEGGTNTNSNFGYITASGSPRSLQLGSKLTW